MCGPREPVVVEYRELVHGLLPFSCRTAPTGGDVAQRQPGQGPDFVPGLAGSTRFFVYRLTDADLAAAGGSALVNQRISAVPETGAWALMPAGLAGVARLKRGRARPAS